jgi:hypothetical protein
MRMDAIRMRMRVEGLVEEAGSAKKPAIRQMSKGLQELLELAEQEKTG